MIAGRYRLTRPLGKGGMGTVWVAVQEPLGREVALKLIRTELVNEARVRERFRREARLVAQLNNPHIVTVLDFGETDAPGGGTTLFIAMELLRGRTLRERLRSGPVSPRESALIVREIADALVTAHAGGVIHRDLKPDNVMLAENGPRPASVKLVDFGVARSLTPEAGSQRLTQTGVMVGTPGYLAPEVVLGEEAGPSSDLYSVGVLWFEMLARRQPFAAQTPLALAMMHASEPAPRLKDKVPTVPTGLADLVDELLRKDPAGRPRDAAALVSRVEELLARGLDEQAAPTVVVEEPDTPFDQTRVQLIPTTVNMAAATPQPATQPSVRTATLPPLVRDTRPDPPTQPTTLRLATAPPMVRGLVYAAGGAVVVLGIAAAALFASTSGKPGSGSDDKARRVELDAGVLAAPLPTPPAPAPVPRPPPPASETAKPPLERNRSEPASETNERPSGAKAPAPDSVAPPPEGRPSSSTRPAPDKVDKKAPTDKRPPADVPHEPRIELDPG